ncbi:efflux RND transporter periplasmic adaptor subunit [Kordiimonas lacus]|uniref:RND family efflux transporter, MFP subunit n=1 Tax=Kordiimonas lacus TaxID=637679 RepID=A0A1G7EHN0_9PROT|nr:efflux RND transporter periplasmic adaptor subunit [Kordiimonas lacus]SDE63151.1 RND family efflux transporter, MFP subunit [Kordiimonas lacus]
MKRVVEAFHVAKGSEKAIGLVQVALVIAVVVGTIAITKIIRLTGDNGPGYSSTQAGLVVDVFLPKAASHTPRLEITGEVSARAGVALTPQVGGRVVSVSPKLEPGALVEAGEVLFTIEPRDYELALEQAEAEVAAAESDLLQTRANADNFIRDWKRVFPDKPAPALVAKEPQVQALEARLKAAKAAAERAKLNLARTRFSVDYPARIVASSVERGQLAAAGVSYGSLYATDSLRITAGIAPKDLARLQLDVGDKVRISDEFGASEDAVASITQLGGVLDSRTRLQDVIIALPEGHTLVPGTFATVELSGHAQDNIYKLPISALATATSVWRVKNTKLEDIAVDVVDIDNDHVYVRAFDVADGVVISEVPTSFVARSVTIRKAIRAEGASGDAS